MIHFNGNNFEIISSETSVTLFGVENKKVYFLNETSQYIFESIANGISLEATVNDFCKNREYDINVVYNDFKKTIDYLLKEGIFCDE